MIQLTFYSKHNKYFKKFHNFLLKKVVKLNINLLKKTTIKRNKTKKISILKSPHVHKVAQDQFEFKVHLNKINIYTSKSFKLLTLIKKLKNYLYSGIKMKIKKTTNTNYQTMKIDGFMINTYKIDRSLRCNEKILMKSCKHNEINKILNFLDLDGGIGISI